LRFGHVRGHDGTLRHPQERRANTQDGAGGDDKGAIGVFWSVHRR
jgi:hypothetical protein